MGVVRVMAVGVTVSAVEKLLLWLQLYDVRDLKEQQPLKDDYIGVSLTTSLPGGCEYLETEQMYRATAPPHTRTFCYCFDQTYI